MGLPSGADRYRGWGCFRLVGASIGTWVRASRSVSGCPTRSGRRPAARGARATRGPNVGPSVFRRLLGSLRRPRVRAAAPPSSSGALPLRPRRCRHRISSLEAELAERLDSVLGIAERLATSHDREELFRTIVDETKRALAGRRHHDPHPARRPPRGRGLGRPVRRRRAPAPVVPQRRGLGRRGPADRPRPGLAGRPARPEPRLRAIRGRPRVRRQPDRAAHPPRPGHRGAGRGDAASRATGPTATSPSSRRSRRTPRSP